MKRRLALFTLLLACADDDGPKLVNGLSRDEQFSLCEWFALEQYDGLTPDAECLPAAVFGTSTQSACEASFDGCRTTWSGRRDERRLNQLRACTQVSIGADCGVTVDQFQTCIRDRMERLRELAAALSCNAPMPMGGFSEQQLALASCADVVPGCIP